MNEVIAEVGAIGDLDYLAKSGAERIVPTTTLPAASMLVNLGAFLGDLGILMKQGQVPPPTPEQKREAAKQVLIGELERLRGQIDGDAGVPAPTKRESLRKIDQAIGGLRACNSKGMFNATLDITDAGNSTGIGRPWEDLWRQLWLMSQAMYAKAMWDGTPPQNQANRRVVYDDGSNTIWFMIGTTFVILIAWGIHANKQAQQVARDLDAMFRRCDYPDKAMADRIADLRKP